MIENEKDNRELVFSNEKTKKAREIERNAFSVEPLDRGYDMKKTKNITDVGPYLQQQSINEKENYHIINKKESSIPKLVRMPSKKFEKKNSIEKC